MITRRELLGAGALVVGFLPLSRTWVEAAHAASSPPFDAVPPLDGTLHLDAATRQADARDQGNIVERVPCAVLRPGSAEDIRKMILFCREHGIQVATRGQGHSTYGQGLVGGLLIESRSLCKIYAIGPAGADVDAGVIWTELVDAAYAHRLTPPVLTGYIGLSIGGTLSVGGVSRTNGHGLQIDRVSELEVVTGAGELRRCSMTQDRELFEAVLGGLGQFAVITRATVDLIPAKARAREYRIPYLSPAPFFRDMRTLLARGELDGIHQESMLVGTSVLYELHAVKFFDPGSPPNDAHLLRGLTVPPLLAIKTDTSYLTWAKLVNVLVAALQATGWDHTVKPWFDIWLPDSAVEQYVTEVSRSITPLDVGEGGVLIFPQRRSKITRPFMRIPPPDGSDWIFEFGINNSSYLPGPNPSFAAQMLDRNRRLFEKARAVGGTRYPIGAIDFSHEDWVTQYGDSWPEFERRKLLFDPDNILTPGQGVF